MGGARQGGKNALRRPPIIMPDGDAVLDAIGDPGYPGRIDPKSLTKDERRSAVAVLYAAGWSPTAIARRVGVSLKTIYNDMTLLRKQAANEISGITVRDLAGHFNLRFEFLYRKAIEAMTLIEDPVERLKAINQAVNVQKAQVEMLKRLGFQVGEEDKGRFEAEVQQQTLVYVQRLMVVMEKHVDEGRRMELADDFKRVLDDVPYSIEEAK